MSDFLFSEFEATSPAAWKQKIQVDLKGEDYNETLLWKTNEGITVKPFYTKEDANCQKEMGSKEGFRICQTIIISNEQEQNLLLLDAIKRGVTAVQFIAKRKFNLAVLLQGIDLTVLKIYIKLSFLDATFTAEIAKFIPNKYCYFQIDILGSLAEDGNWFVNLKEDYRQLEHIVSTVDNALVVSGDLYQNAGANMVQQLAYSLAHANEYLNHFGAENAHKIHFQFSVAGHYFHEIAKLRAFRLLWEALLKEYGVDNATAHIFVQPATRNKTLYDYNVNMLRTTSECMSAILGGADTISNLPYDHIYAEKNDFGERIARNQLLILQQESGFQKSQNFAEGSYYISSLSTQMAEKALTIFKQIEQGGGFLKQLKEGNIQRKIKENASKEDTQFRQKELVLLGANLYPNKENLMHGNLAVAPFAKQRNIKTLFPPITRKRISENLEKQRLQQEIDSL
jgi:methylmalonyl-CoA mutase